jgi:hypothetical protein
MGHLLVLASFFVSYRTDNIYVISYIDKIPTVIDGVNWKILQGPHKMLCTHRSHIRQGWHKRRTNTAAPVPEAILEHMSRKFNSHHGHYDEDNNHLRFNLDFLRAFAAQHPALRVFVEGVMMINNGTDGATRDQGWRTTKAGWNLYYPEVGDGELACRHFTDASAAAGALVQSDRAATTAPNCVVYALGAHVGASESPGVDDGGVPTLLSRALVGYVRKHPESGRNEVVMTPDWAHVMERLGLESVCAPIVGDIVVYTIKKAWLPEGRNEFAVHFGRLASAEASSGLLVESKSGYAFHVYRHPLNVIDPTYLIEAPCMLARFYRIRSPPLPTQSLVELARRWDPEARTC